METNVLGTVQVVGIDGGLAVRHQVEPDPPRRDAEVYTLRIETAASRAVLRLSPQEATELRDGLTRLLAGGG